MKIFALILILIFVAYFLIVRIIGPSMILKPRQKVFLIDGKIIKSPDELGLDYENVEIKSLMV